MLRAWGEAVSVRSRARSLQHLSGTASGPAEEGRAILKTCPAVSSVKFNLSSSEREELSQPWLDFFF